MHDKCAENNLLKITCTYKQRVELLDLYLRPQISLQIIRIRGSNFLTIQHFYNSIWQTRNIGKARTEVSQALLIQMKTFFFFKLHWSVPKTTIFCLQCLIMQQKIRRNALVLYDFLIFVKNFSLLERDSVPQIMACQMMPFHSLRHKEMPSYSWLKANMSSFQPTVPFLRH